MVVFFYNRGFAKGYLESFKDSQKLIDGSKKLIDGSKEIMLSQEKQIASLKIRIQGLQEINQITLSANRSFAKIEGAKLEIKVESFPNMAPAMRKN